MEGSRWKAAGRRRGRAEIRGREGRAPWGGRSGQRPRRDGRWGPDGWDHALGGLTAGAVRAKDAPWGWEAVPVTAAIPLLDGAGTPGGRSPQTPPPAGRGSSLRIWRESE